MLRPSLFFITIFIITLIFTAPMQWVYSQFKTPADPIKLTNIQGSIWSGSATLNISTTNPAYSADNWQWSLNPSALLRLDLEWNILQSRQKLNADIGSSLLAFTKDFNIDLHSDMKNLSVINPIFSLVSGTFQAQLQNFNNQSCIENTGLIIFQDIMAMGIKLAELEAEIQCNKAKQFEITFQSNDPLTQIKGSINLDVNGRYSSSITASSKDPDTSQRLANIATKTLSKDKYLLQATGSLNTF